MSSPPSQSSTLKLDSDPAATGARGGTAPPLLYDAMPTLSRYEQLGLSMASYSVGAAGTGGSNSTLSSAGSTVTANGPSAGGGSYLHHTLPHNLAQQSGGSMQQQHRDPLNLADYLATSSLIDYGLNKPPPAAHMTLPKGLGMGLGMGMGMGGGSVIAAGTSLSPSQLNTITHKSAAGRNHIITDTLPGPESCV